MQKWNWIPDLQKIANLELGGLFTPATFFSLLPKTKAKQ
jgi:hypothetical protein